MAPHASFRFTQEGILCERFLGTQHASLLEEFRRSFEALAASTPGIPEEILESAFINELNPKISAELGYINQIGWVKLWKQPNGLKKEIRL